MHLSHLFSTLLPSFLGPSRILCLCLLYAHRGGRPRQQVSGWLHISHIHLILYTVAAVILPDKFVIIHVIWVISRRKQWSYLKTPWNVCSESPISVTAFHERDTFFMKLLPSRLPTPVASILTSDAFRHHPFPPLYCPSLHFRPLYLPTRKTSLGRMLVRKHRGRSESRRQTFELLQSDLEVFTEMLSGA